MASCRVLPWVPTSSRISPVDWCWLNREVRSTRGRARVDHFSARSFWMLAARDRFYLEAAHVCVDTDGKTVEEIVEEILQKEETE